MLICIVSGDYSIAARLLTSMWFIKVQHASIDIYKTMQGVAAQTFSYAKLEMERRVIAQICQRVARQRVINASLEPLRLNVDHFMNLCQLHWLMARKQPFNLLCVGMQANLCEGHQTGINAQALEKQMLLAQLGGWVWASCFGCR